VSSLRDGALWSTTPSMPRPRAGTTLVPVAVVQREDATQTLPPPLGSETSLHCQLLVTHLRLADRGFAAVAINDSTDDGFVKRGRIAGLTP
jgi:hypothetical protein